MTDFVPVQFQQGNDKLNKAIISGIIVAVLLLIGAVYLYFYKAKTAPEISYNAYESRRLVPEKISQSGYITFYLPPNINKEFAQNNIQFTPSIKGNWLKDADGAGKLSFSLKKVKAASEQVNSNTIFFQPSDNLALNHYYLVSLKMEDESAIESDFLAVENPKIVSVFPASNSETPENSEITIVFNRPMVPLTTLSVLEEKDVPIEIFPATEGRFKWITTRNLQFIPKERLQRSSNYKVVIKEGLASMEGVPMSGLETNFTTRKLRYVNITNGDINYNQPIALYFNQPVDLERTMKEISLVDNATGKVVPFTAEYQKITKKSEAEEKISKSNFLIISESRIKNFFASVSSFLRFGQSSKEKDDKEVSQSVIQIYNLEDKFGREKLWNFDNNYTLHIERAYPLEGDISLEERRNVLVHVNRIIKQISAESSRTNLANQNFFDSQGKLMVEFYEEIDLSRSRIEAPKLKEIKYGEKCKEDNLPFDSCEKIADKRKIYFIFDSGAIGLEESIEIIFQKIINLEGLEINREPIKEYIKSYSRFSILDTYPRNQTVDANTNELIICSNAPILVPATEDFKKYVVADKDYKINYWYPSYKITDSQSSQCKPGEFRTSIYYGLAPNEIYNINLNLEDVFGQKAVQNINFTTGAIDEQHLNFFHFQRDYNVTSPEKTKLTFAVENMEYVNMDICKLSSVNFLKRLKERVNYLKSPGIVTECSEKLVKRIDLPKKYWSKNYFQVNVGDYFENPIGHYLITFYNPNYRAIRWDYNQQGVVPVYERTYLTVTNLTVVEKRLNLFNEELGKSQQGKDINNLYWVTDAKNLEPINNAKISIYKGQKTGDFNLERVYSTNNNGIALIPAVNNLRGAIINYSNDSTVITSGESSLNWASSANLEKRIYIYTDKPIYRPTQEVFIKGIYRIGYDAHYEIFRDKKANIKIYNSKYEEISNQNLDINEFGTFSAKIVLEKNTPLGTYRICGDNYQCTYFDVEEYAPSAFEANVSSDKEEYISKDTVNLSISANYYFGVPVEGGKVSYTVSSQNYYFDRFSKKDGYYNFENYPYDGYLYDDFDGRYYYGDRFILRGEVDLGIDGKAEISKLFDFEKIFKNADERRSKIFIVNVTVRNSSGQSVSAEKSFIIHAGEFYLGISAEKTFLAKNQPVDLKIASVDTKGEAVKVKNITLNIAKIKWVSAKRQEAGGNYSYKWEKQKEIISTYNFDTDRDENFIQKIQIPQEGEYEAEVLANDNRGNAVKSIQNIYVYGEGEVAVQPLPDTNLEITASKVDLNVGDEGEIIIKSPYVRSKVLIAVERGKIFDYQIKNIEGNLFNYKFKIKDEYAPNVFVSALVVSANPSEVRFGTKEFKINTERKKLDVEVKSNKKYYLPGEEVVLDIAVKDYQKSGVFSELSVAVVDLSVLALKGNPQQDPLVFFYGGFPLTVMTSSNIKNILIEKEFISTKGGSGGGLAAEDLAKKQRGEFKETAFWQGAVKTDKNGRARIKFVLPDNLTTWRVESIGVSQDTKLGVNYEEFMTRKELMVVPLKPRFIVPGDVFYIGTKIFNQSQSSQKLTVSFDSQTLLLEDDWEKKVTIGSDKTDTLYFKVKAPEQLEKGIHQFVLSAKSASLEDTVSQSISITPNDTYETNVTAGYTAAEREREYLYLPSSVIQDKGSLTVKSAATLTVFLSDSLNYLLEYPYGCVEQIASRLNAIAIIKSGLNIPNLSEKFNIKKINYQGVEYGIEDLIDTGLAEIYNLQKEDGGFAFWRNGNSSIYATLPAVEALINLSKAGVSVNQNVVKKASEFILRKATTDTSFNRDIDNIIHAVYVLSLVPNTFQNEALLVSLKQKIALAIIDGLFINEKISNNSLAYLSILMTNDNSIFDQEMKNKVFNVLDNRIKVDGRGAYLEPNNNFLGYYFETPIKNTALYLKSLTARKSDNAIIDKILRWLLYSRDKKGAWHSTNNTLTTIDAFIDFLKWKRETESDFNLDLLINKKDIGSFHFDKNTILDQFVKEVSLSEIEFDITNLVEFRKKNNNNLGNNYYYDMALKYYFPANAIPPRDEGFSVLKEFYALEDIKNENPILKAKVGDVIRAHLQIVVPQSRQFVAVEDFIPAGMEIVNLSLATEQKSLRLQEKELKGREFMPDFQEFRDDRAFLYKETLLPGVYEFDYYVRALVPGSFIALPTIVSEMYFPENFGRTASGLFEIN